MINCEDADAVRKHAVVDLVGESLAASRANSGLYFGKELGMEQYLIDGLEHVIEEFSPQ